MKTKPYRIVLVVLLVAVVGGLAWQVLRTREPVYQGKTLDAWLDDLATRRPTAYSEALRKIGPAAIPGIIRKLGQNDSPLHNAYHDRWPTLPSVFRKFLPQPKQPGFSSSDADRAFRLIGSEATRPLIRALKHRNPAVREASLGAINLLIRTKELLTTEEATTLFIGSLRDEDAGVRGYAALALGRIGPAASNAVPALTAALRSSEAGRKKTLRVYVRANAATALGEIGPSAQSAIPALTNLLTSGDTYLRVQAAAAIWRITSNDSVALPVLMSDAPKLEINSRRTAFEALGEMGPRAKAAVPMLLNALNDTNVASWMLAPITNALKQIDPEAAAKAGVK